MHCYFGQIKIQVQVDHKLQPKKKKKGSISSPLCPHPFWPWRQLFTFSSRKWRVKFRSAQPHPRPVQRWADFSGSPTAGILLLSFPNIWFRVAHSYLLRVQVFLLYLPIVPCNLPLIWLKKKKLRGILLLPFPTIWFRVAHFYLLRVQVFSLCLPIVSCNLPLIWLNKKKLWVNSH